jgi:hypothetical protein
MPGTYTGNIGVGYEPGTDQAPLTFTVSAGTSAAFKNNTNLIRIHTDGIASFLVSAAGTSAVANTNARMAANQTEYFMVPMGQGYKISFVTST